MRAERQKVVQDDPNAYLWQVGAGIVVLAGIVALVGASFAWTFAHRSSGSIAPQEIATIASPDKPAKVPLVVIEAPQPEQGAAVRDGNESAGAKTTPQAAKPTKATAVGAANKVVGGLFAVQFGAAGSKAEARDIMRKVASKYRSQIGGRRLGYHHVKDGGKFVYRVDVGGMSKEAAAAICEKVKSAGGNCFVTGN